MMIKVHSNPFALKQGQPITCTNTTFIIRLWFCACHCKTPSWSVALLNAELLLAADEEPVFVNVSSNIVDITLAVTNLVEIWNAMKHMLHYVFISQQWFKSKCFMLGIITTSNWSPFILNSIDFVIHNARAKLKIVFLWCNSHGHVLLSSNQMMWRLCLPTQN